MAIAAHRTRLFIGVLVLAALATAVWVVTTRAPARAAPVLTSTVSAGPDTFNQIQPTGAPSQYSSTLERCANGTDYQISGPNPILSEPPTTTFTSNLPLTVAVRDGGDRWWNEWKLIFTNRSSQAFHVDCAVIIFRASSGSGDHSYRNARPFGHPQQDYREVPKGDGTSYYIIRLGFHDVPLANRVAYPGQSFEYSLWGERTGNITAEQVRDSIRFYGDLDLRSNGDLVRKYGTQRMTN